MSQDTLRVKLFGSLREFGDRQNAELLLPPISSVTELRATLAKLFQEKFPDSQGTELLKDCAFADEKSILTAEASLEGRTFVAVLPPVCGG